jgi:hypothetical protein
MAVHRPERTATMGTSPVAAMPLEVPLVRGVVREMRVSGRGGRCLVNFG